LNAVLFRLRDAGLRVRVEGDKVLVSPKGRLTPELADYIRQHKAEIIRVLTPAPEPGLNELAELGRSRWHETPFPLEMLDWLGAQHSESARVLHRSLYDAAAQGDVEGYDNIMCACRGLWLTQKAAPP